MSASKAEVAKESRSNSINLVLGFGIGALANIIILPYLFNDTPEYLGGIQVAVSLVYIIADAITLGAPTMIVRYFNDLYLKSNQSLWTLLRLPLTLLLSGYILFLSAYWAFPDFLLILSSKATTDTTSNFVAAIIIGTFIVASSKILSGLLNALGYTSQVSFANEVLFRVLILVWSFSYYFLSKDILVGTSLVLVFIAVCIYLLIKLIKTFRGYSLVSENESSSMSEVVKFSLFSGARSLTNTLQQRLDVVILSFYLGNADVVIFNIAAYLAAVIGIPSRAIDPMAATVVSRSWTTGDLSRIQRVYTASALNQLLLSGLILICIVGCIPIFRAVLPSSFQGFEVLLVLLGLSKYVNVCFGINSTVISTSPSYKLSFLFHVSLVVLLVIGFVWLIPIFGKEGAAMASFSAFLIFNLFKVVFLDVKYGFTIVNKKYLLVALLMFSAVFAGIGIAINVDSIFINLIYSLVSVLALLWIAIKYQWSEDLNEMAMNTIYEVKSRFK